MKKVCGIVILAAIVTVGILFCLRSSRSEISIDSPEKFIPGTNLKLVKSYDPLRIFLYVDTSSTNRIPDYVIFRGHEPLVSSENHSSNTIETTYLEKGLYVDRTLRDDHGRLLERSVNYNDELGHQKYGYIDKDGD